MKKVIWLGVLLFGFVTWGRGQTLQERIDKAPENGVIEVGAGSYEGSIVISRPLTLRGEGWPKIEGDGDGHVVKITGDRVTLEGFRIEHSGLDLTADHAGVFIEGNEAVIRNNRIERVLHGIYVKAGKRARIEGNLIDGLVYLPEVAADVLREGFTSRPTEICSVVLDTSRRGNGIHLWNSESHQVRNNTILNTRDGIYFSFTHRTWVYGNQVTDVRYGLHYMYSDANTFEENTFMNNAAGAAIMYSEGIRAMGNRFSNNRGKRAYGLLLQSVDDSEFTDNHIVENTIGLYLENSQRNRFRGNRLERNYVGIRFSTSSSGNQLSTNYFRHNLHPVELDQSEKLNVWSVDHLGNYWGSGDSPDLDGNGVGEWSHFESDVLGQMRREHALVGLMSGSAFIELIHFAASRCRIVGLPMIEDPYPMQTN